MSDSKFIDYYALLSVSFNATNEQIKENYENAILQAEDGSDHKSLLELAYTVLSDDDKRKVYDESYVRLQMGDSNDTEIENSSAEAEENADSLLELTEERYREFDQFISEQLSNKDANMQIKEETADKAEALYKRGMWPLLGKLKTLVGETSSFYIKACEFHSKAIFSLGDLCMWATHYERAIGMYNTALALSANNYELAVRCAKAIELAKIAFDESRLATAPVAATAVLQPDFAFEDLAEEETVYLPYKSVALFVMLGLFFTMFCLWSVLLLLDTIFLY